MENKFTISKSIKKLFILVCLFVLGLGLASCDSSNRKATGDLDLNQKYATAGQYSVTLGDVYDELRYSATDYLDNRVSEILLKDEIQAVKEDLAKDDSKYAEKMNEYILKDIYETSEQKEIDALSAKEVKHHIDEYIDKMYLKGYKLTYSEIENNDFTKVYPNYYVTLAKYVKAYNTLVEDYGKNEDGSIKFGDLNSEDAKIKASDVVTEYKNNYKNHGDLDLILVRLLSSTEASNVLRTFGIKYANSIWYQIQLPEDQDSDVYKNEVDYNKYYSETSISTSSTSTDVSLEAQGAGMSTILKVFAEIYNYIYTYQNNYTTRNTLVYDENLTFAKFAETYTGPAHLVFYNFVKKIAEVDAEYRLANTTEGVYSDEAKAERYNAVKDAIANCEQSTNDNKYTHFDYERINGINSSLKTYVYETLATSSESGTYTQYTSSASSYGDYYYFVFKIAQEADPELYVENKTDDKTTYDFSGHEELLNEILMKLFEEKLTDSYISEVFEKLVKEAKIYIYDSIMELNFMQGSSVISKNYSKTRKTSKENIAMVKINKVETPITVKEFFNALEPLNGSSIASTLLFNKFIKNQKIYKDLEKNYDNYLSSLKMVLNYFENDYYSSSGYPSTLGKFNFMRLVYHSAKADDIIRNSLMLSDAKSYFFANIDNFFTVDEFVAKLVDYAHVNYVNYYNLGATKINVYVDYDEDGKADEIEVGSELAELVNELLYKAIQYISKSKDNYTTALSSFISEYKGTERFGDETNQTKAEYLWAKYRKAGIVVSSETLTATNDSKLADDVVELIKKYYNDETIIDLELGLVSEVFSYDTFYDDNKYSSLIVTSGTLRTSAKYDDEDKIEKMYTNIPSIYNEAFVETVLTKDDYANEEANAKLIKAYLYDYLLFQSVSSLPSSTTSALNAYVLPLLQRYISSTSQQIIIKNTLGTITYDYTEACHVGLNEAFDEAFTRANFASERYSILERQYDDYEEAYENWWTTFYTGLKEAK